MHENHINDFQMALNIPIDCHNGETFIKVNQMQYPQSIPNIDKNYTCWFSLDIEFNDFLLNSSKQAISSILLLSISKQFISHGIYEIEDLCDIMNETLDQFDINVKLGKDNIIFIDYSFYYEYWCNQKKSTTGKAQDGGTLNSCCLITTSWSKKKKNAGMKITLNLSKKLSYMLGFYEETYIFEQKGDGKSSDYYAFFKKADIMPDKSDG